RLPLSVDRSRSDIARSRELLRREGGDPANRRLVAHAGISGSKNDRRGGARRAHRCAARSLAGLSPRRYRARSIADVAGSRRVDRSRGDLLSGIDRARLNFGPVDEERTMAPPKTFSASKLYISLGDGGSPE